MLRPQVCISRVGWHKCRAQEHDRTQRSCEVLCVQAMTYAIERSCINKSEVVSADEKEGGVRATLNLGHTFGHAMESSQGYGTLPYQHCILSMQVLW